VRIRWGRSDSRRTNDRDIANPRGCRRFCSGRSVSGGTIGIALAVGAVLYGSGGGLAPAHARVVWGDVHAHSGISDDAEGDPTAFYLKARDQAHLDFVILTDHDIWVTQEEWQRLTELAAAFNDPGRFVTFLAIEWTHAYHMNVYFRGSEGQICSGEDSGPPCPTSAGFAYFYAPYVMAGDAGAHVNHPRWQVPWQEVDTAVTPNAEMYNDWWDRLWNPDRRYDNERGFGTLGWALQVGLRLGFVGASDYHGHKLEGPIGSGLTGCEVDDLTRDDILAALRERRCYATDGERIVLHFDVDGTPMGGELTAPIGSVITPRVVVKGTAVPSAIELLRNGDVVATKTDCTSSTCSFSAPMTVDDETTFVYARVQQPGDCRAWASPIWIRGVCERAADCPLDRFVTTRANSTNECLYRWRVLDASVRRDRMVACTDGDPACDSGDTPGECTFRVAACAGVTAGEPSCAAEPVTTLRLRRPNTADAAQSNADLENRLTLLTALRALGPTIPPGRCTPYVDVRVPLARDGAVFGPGARWLSGQGGNAEHRDADSLRLYCLPPDR